MKVFTIKIEGDTASSLMITAILELSKHLDLTSIISITPQYIKTESSISLVLMVVYS
jgi:hypothetical protein